MSKQVDERVVSMQFDNKQFEKNVSTTLSTIDKLKQALNFKGASKGIDETTTGMSGIGSAVQAVSTKFSAMQVMAVTALANITNSAVNAGKRIVSALTIDPIKTGFGEYETQIGAVQTILANTESKGSTLQDVNRALDELNTYADKTIYNFTEMTKNIGTFTAAGIELDTSVKSIQGIANLAAVSGSTSQQASTAMYQLSQALASGTVKLMDWNSVVNAGMGGQVFQDALLRTAGNLSGSTKSVEELRKEVETTFGSFRESLQDGWITTEVLTKTLEQLTLENTESNKQMLIAQGYTEAQAQEILQLAETAQDAATKVKTFTQLWDTLKESAQSGWTQTWEIIIGDFEEAKTFLTKISDTIGPMISASADARNAVLSGALSSGWKQLLNQGIADEAGYVDEIKNVAKEHGVSIDEMIKAEQKLDKSLSDGEAFQKVLKQGLTDGSITSDMLTESVNKLGDKMAKMSDAELEAAGYTKDHVKQIADLRAKLESGAISMDEYTDKMQQLSGREVLIKALENAFEGVLSVIKPIKEAFTEIFPPITAEQLRSLIDQIYKLSENFKISETTADNLKRTFKGLFAVLDIVRQLFVAIAKAVSPVFGKIGDLGAGLLETTATWGDWLVNLNETIKTTDVFGKAMQKITEFITKARDAIQSFINSVKVKFVTPGMEVFHAFLGRIQDRLASVGEATEGVREGIAGAFKALGAAFVNADFLNILKSLWNGVKTIVSGIMKAFGALTSGIVEKMGSGDFNGVFDFINNALFSSGFAVFIAKFVNGFTDVVKMAENFKDSVLDILDSFKECLTAWQRDLQAKTLLKIAGAIAILAASILVISLIDSEKLSKSLAAITVLFADLMGSMAIFNKISENSKGTMKAALAMIGMSLAVLIMAAALKKIGSLDPGEMAVGLVGVIGLTATVVQAAKMLSSGEKKVLKGATNMVIFALAIKILASALIDIAQLSAEQMAVGLVGVMGLIATVVQAAKILSSGDQKNVIKGALRMVIFATAIKILASACIDLSGLNWNQLAKGLLGIGVILAEVIGFTKLMNSMKIGMSTALSMVMIGLALKIFASAAQSLGNLSWESLAKGLLGIGLSLIAIVGAVKLMPKDMMSMGAGLIAVAIAISILTKALDVMGAMSWESIAKSLLTLAGSIGILALGLHAMMGTEKGATAMITAAVAIAILAPALSMLGAMSWESIVRGFVAIAGAITIFGVAAKILQPLLPAMLKLAGVFLVFGVAVLAVGAGLLVAGVGISAVAAGITALAAALAGGVTVIVSAIVAIIQGIVSLIPAIITKIGEGLISLCDVIIDGAPAIGEAIKAIVLTIIDVLVECIPALANGILRLIAELLTALAAYTPQIVDAIFNFVIGLLEGVARNLPALIQASVDVLMALFKGIVDALKGIDTNVLLEGLVGIGVLSAIMLALATVAALIPAAMLGVLGMGLVIAELALVLAAIGELSEIPGLDVLIGQGGNLLQVIGTAIGQFVGGIVGGFSAGALSTLPLIGAELSAFMIAVQGFIEGAKNIDSAAMDGIKALASTILILTAANILEGITSFITGESSITKFASELAPLGVGLKGFSDAVVGIDNEAVVSAANAAKVLAEMTGCIPNEGGVAAWFAGENSISKFAGELVPLGEGLKGFSDAVAGIDNEAVVAAANAGKTLAEMTGCIPNSGGVASWFAGENSISKFGEELPKLGEGLKGFSDAVVGVTPETIVAAANAAKALAEMTGCIPNSGGVASWFAGENSISKFGEDLGKLGEGLKKFSDSVTGVNPTNIVAAASAGKALAQMADTIPNEGGVAAWFAGENSMSKFAGELPTLGEGLKGFSDAVSGINPMNIVMAANAAKTLAEMAKITPENTGKLVSFGTNLATLGEKLKVYFQKAGTITAEALAASTKAINAVKKFQTNLKADAISSAADAVKDMVSAMNKLAKIKSTAADGFSKAIDKMAKTSVNKVVETFEKSGTKMYDAGKEIINKFIEGASSMDTKITKAGQSWIEKLTKGISDKKTRATDACKSLLEGCVTAINNNYQPFYNAGGHLVTGFANGITANTYKAEAVSRAMANAAHKAAARELEEKSPSKVGYEIGDFFGIAFVNGIADNISASYDTSTEMASYAKRGLSDAIKQISNGLESDMDFQPTIRPVLDLSDVKAGAGTIGSLFDSNSSVNLLANVGTINSMMNNQNGVNNDIVSAIENLRKDISNMPRNITNVNGVTYDDGSNIATAVETIVRAARIERRN